MNLSNPNFVIGLTIGAFSGLTITVFVLYFELKNYEISNKNDAK